MAEGWVSLSTCQAVPRVHSPRHGLLRSLFHRSFWQQLTILNPFKSKVLCRTLKILHILVATLTATCLPHSPSLSSMCPGILEPIPFSRPLSTPRVNTGLGSCHSFPQVAMCVSPHLSIPLSSAKVVALWHVHTESPPFVFLQSFLSSLLQNTSQYSIIIYLSVSPKRLWAPWG